MTSIAKRKEKVNELRSAHFSLGFQSNLPSASEYAQHYREKPLAPPSILDSKSNHFKIGSDEPAMAQNTYESQFKNKFCQHPLQVPSSGKGGNEENNIVFGFHSSTQKTNYQDEFIKGEGDRGQQINQRLVSIELGDTLSQFTTSYKKSFAGEQGNPSVKVDNNSREANLIFGFDRNPYQTSNSASMPPPPSAVNPIAQRSFTTNVLLGGDCGSNLSEQKAQFAFKQSGYKSVDKNRVLDFKKAHFGLGFSGIPTENLTEAQSHFTEKPLVQVNASNNRTGNIDLKFGDQNNYQSSYKEHFTQKQKGTTAQLQKQGHKDNVIVGLGQNSFTTEAQAQYEAKPIQVVKGIRHNSSLELKDGSNQCYSTQYQQTYTNQPGTNQNNSIGKDDIHKMRAENIVHGFQGVDYKLHSLDYGRGKAETNKLTREAIDKMRSTNIAQESNYFIGKSIHSSSYGWKKNEDF